VRQPYLNEDMFSIVLGSSAGG